MPQMKDVGDIAKNREYYMKTRFPNLTYLFEKRFEWMNAFIEDTDEVLEVGTGIGVTKLFLKKGNITLSDVMDAPWVERREDALNLTYGDGTLDVIIINNTVHHLAHPLEFFKEAHRVLKPGGRILIQDMNCGFFTQRLLRLMHIEDFNFKVDPFNIKEICTDPENPWDGNNAIPNLLFDDIKKFEANVPYFKVVEKKHSEFLVYMSSGGITGKTFAIPLPRVMLKMLDGIDGVLTSTMPKVFALQMHIVLVKR